MRAGFHWDGNLHLAPVRIRLNLEIIPVEQLYFLAVDAELKLLVSNVRADNVVLDRKSVLAISRKDMLDDHSPAGPKRKPFDMVFL